MADPVSENGRGGARRALLLFALLFAGYALIFALNFPIRPESDPAFARLQLLATAADFAFGAVAYTLIGRGILGLFFPLRRDRAFARVLRDVTDPFLALARPVTPGFMLEKLMSFYVAGLILILRKIFPFILVALYAAFSSGVE